MKQFDQHIKKILEGENHPFKDEHWLAAKAQLGGLFSDEFSDKVKNTLEEDKPVYDDEHFDLVEEQIPDAVFDGKLISLLADDQFVFNEEHWSQVRSQLPKKERKRRYLFWIFFGAGLLALSSLVLFTLKKDSKTKDNLIVEEISQEHPTRIETKTQNISSSNLEEGNETSSIQKEVLNNSDDQISDNHRIDSEKSNDVVVQSSTNIFNDNKTTITHGLKSKLKKENKIEVSNSKDVTHNPINTHEDTYIVQKKNVEIMNDQNEQDVKVARNHVNEAVVAGNEQAFIKAESIANIALKSLFNDLPELHLTYKIDLEHLLIERNKKQFSRLKPMSLYLGANTTLNTSDSKFYSGEIGIGYLKPIDKNNRLYAMAQVGYNAQHGKFQSLSSYKTTFTSINAHFVRQELNPDYVFEVVGNIGLSYRVNKRLLASLSVRPRYLTAAYGERMTERTVSSFSLNSQERVSRDDMIDKQSENIWLETTVLNKLSIGADVRATYIINRNWHIGLHAELTPNYLKYKDVHEPSGLIGVKSLIQGGLYVSYQL